MRITKFKARQVFNGQGFPTIEAELSTSRYTVYSSVPIALSTSKYEYEYVFDGDSKTNNISQVENLVNTLNRIVAPEIIGRNVLDQDKLDDLLLDIDDSFDRNKLGVNSMIAISQAIAKLGALESDLPLFKYIRVLHDLDPNTKEKLSSNYNLPIPVITIYRSGLHDLKSKLPAQEIMIYPQTDKRLKNDLLLIFDFLKSFDISEEKKSLNLFLEELHNLLKTFKLKVYIGIDMAASRYFNVEHEEYVIPNLTSFGHTFRGDFNKLTNHYLKFLTDLVDYIEDPFNEDHVSAWNALHKALNTDDRFALKEIVGDDLTATNVNRLEKAILLDAINNVVIKPSQVGTVTEALRFASVANNYGMGITGSYRFGETEDDFIVDFSIGVGAHYLRTGYFLGSEYISKINRLLRIADILV